MLAAYKQRADDLDYLAKLHLIENENDVVSAFFMHLKEPEIIASCYDDRNLQQLCHAHQVYAYKLDQHGFVSAKQKSRMPEIDGGCHQQCIYEAVKGKTRGIY